MQALPASTRVRVILRKASRARAWPAGRHRRLSGPRVPAAQAIRLAQEVAVDADLARSVEYVDAGRCGVDRERQGAVADAHRVSGHGIAVGAVADPGDGEALGRGGG